MTFRVKCLTAVIIFVGLSVHADDGAASIAAGGIVVMKKESRITMAKEVLQISASKVIVDYDFRNDSDEDITTEVAFPIPDYSFEIDWAASAQGFDDFRLLLDGVPVRYQIETRAFVGEKEYTNLLNSMRVDIASFGRAVSKENVNSKDLLRLSNQQRKQLERVALIDSAEGDPIPLWTVRKKYHWKQTFPAHKIVHIRHEYTPYAGTTNGLYFDSEDYKSLCVEGGLSRTLQQIAKGKDKWAWQSWVDFILTTANTWKTPIEDFMLIVERPHGQDWKTKRDNYVSFCWDSPVTKIDGDHFSAHVQNFVPKKELRVGFFTVESNRMSN